MVNKIFKRIARSLLMFAILAISSAADLAAQTPSVPSIKALHEYADKNGVSPKDYIFKLFEKSDIVVLGERDIVTRYSIILFSTCLPIPALPSGWATSIPKSEA